MTMTRSRAARPTRDEGFALPLVLLLIVVVGAVATLLFQNAQVTARATSDARNYEAALHDTEVALEKVFADLRNEEGCPTLVTDWQGPEPGDDTDDPRAHRAAERAEVLRQIEVLGDEAFVAEIGEHRYVYAAARIGGATGTGDYHVVRARLGDDGCLPGDPSTSEGGAKTVTFGDFALHINGGLTVSGHVQQIAGAGVAANGTMTVRQGFGELLRARNLRIASDTGKIECSDSWCPVFRQTAGHPAPMAGSVTLTTPPVLAARDVHRRYAAEIGGKPGVGDWYDLCYPDPAQGRPYPSVHQAPTTPGAEPCTGVKIQDVTGSWPTATYRGWEYRTVGVSFFTPTGATQTRNVEMWTKSSGDGGYPDNGVYYAHERNVMTSDLWNASARLTIIASADPADLTGADYGGRSGNVWWQGNSHYYHYNGVPGFQLAVFADRDIVAQGTAHADGVVYAREQFRSFANNFRLIGHGQGAGAPFGPAGGVEPDNRSSPGSPVHQTAPLEWGPGGSFTFDYHDYRFDVDTGDSGDGPSEPGSGTDTMKIGVLTWDEL